MIAPAEPFQKFAVTAERCGQGDLQKLAGWIHGTVYDGIGSESGLRSGIFSGCSSQTEAIRWNSCLTG
jgi:hypothetical protein